MARTPEEFAAELAGENLIKLLEREESVQIKFVKVNLEIRTDRPPIPGWSIRLESNSGIGNVGINLNCNALELGTCVALQAILDRCEHQNKIGSTQ